MAIQSTTGHGSPVDPRTGRPAVLGAVPAIPDELEMPELRQLLAKRDELSEAHRRSVADMRAGDLERRAAKDKDKAAAIDAALAGRGEPGTKHQDEVERRLQAIKRGMDGEYGAIVIVDQRIAALVRDRQVAYRAELVAATRSREAAVRDHIDRLVAEWQAHVALQKVGAWLDGARPNKINGQVLGRESRSGEVITFDEVIAMLRSALDVKEPEPPKERSEESQRLADAYRDSMIGRGVVPSSPGPTER